MVSDKVQQILGFSEDFLPSVYLGIPFFMGSNKASYWSSVIQHIQCRIASWKVRWLSLAGRILLIKSVLAAIPNYFIVVLKIRSGVLDTIKKLIKGFLWSGNLDDSHKVPLISWQDMLYASNVGGAGIHDLSLRNEAFGGKLIWHMYTKSQSTWCTIMQQKYLDNNDPSRVLSISNPPKGLVVWDFMIGSRKIIVDYISREVNNGMSINFWNDS